LECCEQLQEVPPLDTLCSLKKLEVADCNQLQQFPPLDGLAALQELFIWNCPKLSSGCLRLPSSQRCNIDVGGLPED
jgi:hypothetical protein